MNAVICDGCGDLLKESDALRVTRLDTDDGRRYWGGHLCNKCIPLFELFEDRGTIGVCARPKKKGTTK